MRIVFIGSVLFSQKALLKLLELKANIVGIITKEKSTYNSDFIDLSSISEEYNIPYRFVKNINHSNNIKWIDELKPDILFCFGWSTLIKSTFSSVFPMSSTNVSPFAWHCLG